MSKLIEIKNVHIDYDLNEDNGEAISDVSLEVNENDFVCILGPSGCGKSTLLKAVAGFIQPTKGQILMDGVLITKPSRLRGVVFQEPNLLPWYNVQDNVGLGPKISGLDTEETRKICDKYLAQVELLDYKDSKVFELSGGQKQRVAIARTLANHPKVILMDEPFGALDSFTRKKMQEMIRRLWQKNQTTIFFVTHDIDEALLLGTRIFVMKKGLQSIVNHYEIDYTHRLLEKPNKHIIEETGFIKLKEEILELLEN